MTRPTVQSFSMAAKETDKDVFSHQPRSFQTVLSEGLEDNEVSVIEAGLSSDINFHLADDVVNAENEQKADVLKDSQYMEIGPYKAKRMTHNPESFQK